MIRPPWNLAAQNDFDVIPELRRDIAMSILTAYTNPFVVNENAVIASLILAAILHGLDQ